MGMGWEGYTQKDWKKKTFRDRMGQMKSEKLRAGRLPEDESGHPRWTAQRRRPRNRKGECLNAEATVPGSSRPRQGHGRPSQHHASAKPSTGAAVPLRPGLTGGHCLPLSPRGDKRDQQ